MNRRALIKQEGGEIPMDDANPIESKTDNITEWIELFYDSDDQI